MLNNRQSRSEFKLEFLKDSIFFGFIIHVSNSMLFLERHNESGTIFTYTNCSGMDMPGKSVQLGKDGYQKVRTFQNLNKDYNMSVKAFILLACFKNLL